MSNSNPPPPKETSERICPQCRSADILALGRVLADNTGMIRSAYRCRECAKEFLLLSTERRPGPERRLGPRDRRANT
jgi:transposase-like protein